MSTVTRTAIRCKKPIVQSGCAQRRSKESGTTGALSFELYRLSSLKVFALKDESLFVYLPFGSRLALSVTAYAVPPLPK